MHIYIYMCLCIAVRTSMGPLGRLNADKKLLQRLLNNTEGACRFCDCALLSLLLPRSFVYVYSYVVTLSKTAGMSPFFRLLHPFTRHGTCLVGSVLVVFGCYGASLRQ
jgi:hypothetical protein